MGLNLRNNAETPIQNLVALFKQRADQVQSRVSLEKDITTANGKLVQQLSELFKPIAVKTSIGFHIRIMDECIEVSTDVILHNKKRQRNQSLRISLMTTSVYEWLKDVNTIRKYQKEVERNLRLLALTSRKDRINGNVVFSRPNVTVGIETRNRYF
jgi:hypothetical protein